MPWSISARNAAVNATARDGGNNWFAAFTAYDASSGTGTEVFGGSYARVQGSYPGAVNGATANDVVEVNIPQGTTVTHWGRFATASGGTPYDVRALPGIGETFGQAGTLKIINNVTVAA